MTAQELESYLREHIPLANFMQVSVVSLDRESVVVGAPLAPNINVHQTLFGGSASAIALIAAWSLLHLRMTEAGIRASLVIHRNTMTYERPIAGPFTAQAGFAGAEAWANFVATLERSGRARITVAAKLLFAGHVAAHLEGEFVATAPRDGGPGSAAA